MDDLVNDFFITIVTAIVCSVMVGFFFFFLDFQGVRTAAFGFLDGISGETNGVPENTVIKSEDIYFHLSSENVYNAPALTLNDSNALVLNSLKKLQENMAGVEKDEDGDGFNEIVEAKAYTFNKLTGTINLDIEMSYAFVIVNAGDHYELIDLSGRVVNPLKGKDSDPENPETWFLNTRLPINEDIPKRDVRFEIKWEGLSKDTTQIYYLFESSGSK